MYDGAMCVVCLDDGRSVFGLRRPRVTKPVIAEVVESNGGGETDALSPAPLARSPGSDWTAVSNAKAGVGADCASGLLRTITP